MSRSFDARHPEVTVRLTGEDGNVFSVAGRVITALRRAGVPREERDKFTAELMASHSYDEALLVVMQWVEVT